MVPSEFATTGEPCRIVVSPPHHSSIRASHQAQSSILRLTSDHLSLLRCPKLLLSIGTCFGSGRRSARSAVSRRLRRVALKRICIPTTRVVLVLGSASGSIRNASSGFPKPMDQSPFPGDEGRIARAPEAVGAVSVDCGEVSINRSRLHQPRGRSGLRRKPASGRSSYRAGESRRRN